MADDWTLRALVASMGGGYEARLLDLDIAVRADSEEQILREIEHALVVTYEIARDLGETPFVSVLRHSPRDERWHEKGARVGSIELPQEVAEALAAVLHRPRPLKCVTVEKKAA